jgi:hypothetical protein
MDSLAVNKTIDFTLLSEPELIDIVEVEKLGGEFDQMHGESADSGDLFGHYLSQIDQEQQEYYQQQGDQRERASWNWTDLGLAEFS